MERSELRVTVWRFDPEVSDIILDVARAFVDPLPLCEAVVCALQSQCGTHSVMCEFAREGTLVWSAESSEAQCNFSRRS
jgi:hypothetical protein